MLEAWSTVVHRESEWTPQARAEAIGAVLAEQIKCPHCGNVDTIVKAPRPVGDGSRRTTKEPKAWFWPARRRSTPPPPDERAFELRRYRCIACAGKAVTERDFARDHENAKTDRGEMAPDDGLFFRVTPHYPEP